MTKHAVKNSVLLESIDTVDNETERNWAGAKIIGGRKKVVTNATSQVTGKKLIV